MSKRSNKYWEAFARRLASVLLLEAASVSESSRNSLADKLSSERLLALAAAKRELESERPQRIADRALPLEERGR